MARSKRTKEGINRNLPFHPIYREYRDIANRWMIELLVPLGVHKEVILEQLCREDEVLCELGLSAYAEAVPFDSVATRTAIFDLYKSVADKPFPSLPTKTQLAKNICWLGKTIGLNALEQKILHFRVILSRHMLMRECVRYLGIGIDLVYVVNLLARLLDANELDIEKALQPNASLVQAGLISIKKGMLPIIDKIDILPGLADNLLGMSQDPYRLYQNNFIRATAPKLSQEDYPHLQDDILLLSSYLNEAIQTKRLGVNVLIYGTPGSGKTEFVKMLAQQIGSLLFEVATENMAGEPLRRSDRFRSFYLAQHILSGCRTSSLILFDEVEDVFSMRNDDDDAKSGNSSSVKGWVNKLLEGNQIPSFWISNSLGCLDKAFVRRFDYVIELNTPPRSVRSKILNQYLEGMDVSTAWKSGIAEHEYLNPAVVERAAKVIEVARHRHPELHAEKALERMMGNTLEALGLPRSSQNPVQSVTQYRLDVLNTDCNIEDICDGLRRHGEGRMCLYGAPGTGKSAFGRYIADMLDRPLMARRASDILSPWVGVAEQNMAKMFREATEENAILLLDEADTFLRDRNEAVRSWEISAVNEMLTQMENFAGIFVASTNLMGSLDPASLRRFDLKIKFDFLRVDQVWALFCDAAERIGFPIADEHQQELTSLSVLTPGDFANIIRQSRLRPIKKAEDLLWLLRAECEAKPGQSRRKIGF